MSRKAITQQSRLPNFYFEKEALKTADLVVGIDEVGVGALAGPVYIGIAAFDISASRTLEKDVLSLKIDDSKKLSIKQREQLENEIYRYGVCASTHFSTVSDINRLGIRKATRKAIRRGINRLREVYGHKRIFLLLDAFYCPRIRAIPQSSQKGIIRGDSLSVSIAAASIIAKVARDRAMNELAKKYPYYGWEKNKGYGTKEHIQSLHKHGKTKLHRELYIRNIFKST
jgi:ribonuclease HII